MPSNTTLDSQHPGCCASGRLKADHSCGSSSSVSGVALAAMLGGASPGRPGPGRGRGKDDKLAGGISDERSDYFCRTVLIRTRACETALTVASQPPGGA